MKKRIHLFEFEDQGWYPRAFRDFTTDYLKFMAMRKRSGLYDRIVPVILKILRSTKHNQIIDLASGSAGAYVDLSRKLAEVMPELRIILTDLYPNLKGLQEATKLGKNMEFIKSPVNVLNVSSEYAGLRTMFLSFHHFRTAEAVGILQNAVDTGNPIAIFEDQERSKESVWQELMSPIRLWRYGFQIRPRKPVPLLFTYVIPVIPFALAWDGAVSCLRTYSTGEMMNLVNKVTNSHTYQWEIKRLATPDGVLLYLTGFVKPEFVHK